MSTLMPKWKWWHNDDKTTMMTKTIITMTKWQWWLKRGQQWWHNDNDKPMMTKKDDKTTMTATTAARYHHCHLFTFIVIDILSSSCHHWIIVMELVTMSSCHWDHRHLIFFIVSSSKSYHHDLIINVILSSYLVFVILSSWSLPPLLSFTFRNGWRNRICLSLIPPEWINFGGKQRWGQDECLY